MQIYHKLLLLFFLTSFLSFFKVDIHREHIKGVELEVECLEQHNISILSELFDRQMDDILETK